MATTKRAKLSVSVLDPKAHVHKLKDAPGHKMTLGSIIGIATGLGETKHPNGIDVSTFLKGTFEIVPADENADTIRSGKCYLPGGMQEDIEAMFEGDDPASEVRFAYEVGIFQADNPQGYSWEFTPAQEVEENDPLADLRAQLPAAQKNKQLADKSGGKGKASE